MICPRTIALLTLNIVSALPTISLADELTTREEPPASAFTLFAEGVPHYVRHSSSRGKPLSVCVASKTGIDHGTVYVVSFGPSFPGKGGVTEDDFSAKANGVAFIDGMNGGIQIAYTRHISPDHSVSSPDGRYVAFSSSVGSEGYGTLGIPDTTTGHNGTNSRDNSRLKSAPSRRIATTRYSIWDVELRRPIWEMPFYRAAAPGFQAARFIRPGTSSNTVEALLSSRIQQYRYSKIIFSPSSKYLIALDERQGVHTLNITSGMQHAHDNNRFGDRATAFWLSNAEDILFIAYSSGIARAFYLKDGQQAITPPLTLPSEYTVASSSELVTPSPQFVYDPLANTFATLSGSQLICMRVASRSDNPSTWSPLCAINGCGATSVCRLQISRDTRWAGIGYGYGYSSHDDTRKYLDNGSVWRFEVADLVSSRVVKRLVLRMPSFRGPGDFSDSDHDRPGITTVATRPFVAFLGSGSDIVYAVASQLR